MNRILPLSLAIIASAMLFVALITGSRQPSAHAQQGGVPTPTPAPEIEPRNEQVPPLEGKLHPPKYDGMAYLLNEIVRQYENGALTARAAAKQAPLHREQSVAVTFHIEEDYVRDIWDYLQANDIPAREPLEDEHFIEAEVPVSLLALASELPGVIVVKPIVPPQPAQFSVGGQGAAAHGARAWHSAGYRGQGVKVGVIDLEFQGFGGLQGSELPSSVQARCYTSSSSFFKPALKLCVRRPTRHSGNGSPLRDRSRCLLLHIASSFERHGQKRRAVDGLPGRGRNHNIHPLAVGRSRQRHISIHQ